MLNRSKKKEVSTVFEIDGIITNDPATIANNLNEYFVNIGPMLDKTILREQTTFDKFLTGSYVSSLVLTPTVPNEIYNIIDDLENKSSSGYDEIPTTVMKATGINICKPLSEIINRSFVTGCFPSSLKVAKVCPLFKSGNAKDVSNYRPISVLSSFSKVFEKAMYIRVISYLNKFAILNEAQYGFRKNYSTYMALLNLHEKITAACDKKEFGIGVFVDLQKAFDTINHTILLHKLEHYGLRGIVLKWFESYLTNRKQYVLYNGTKSTHNDIVCGVPQGSVLGPLLFIIFVNDIVNSSKLLKFILFADDTNLFYSCTDLALLQTNINLELGKLSIWFRANRLSLNVNKTNYVIFRRNQVNMDLAIHIDNIPLTRVNSTKFLGVFIDSKLSWNTHVTNVASKISKGIGALCRVKSLLPKSILLMLYHTMIYPYLNYCCIVWGGASSSVLEPVKVLQRRALRILDKTNYRAPSNPLFIKYNLLKLNDIYLLQVSQFMCRFKLCLLPDYFIPYFTVNHKSLDRVITRSNNFYVIPRYNTCMRKMCIIVQGPKIWDSLPHHLVSACSIGSFTNAARSFLISLYK